MLADSCHNHHTMLQAVAFATTHGAKIQVNKAKENSQRRSGSPPPNQCSQQQRAMTENLTDRGRHHCMLLHQGPQTKKRTARPQSHQMGNQMEETDLSLEQHWLLRLRLSS